MSPYSPIGDRTFAIDFSIAARALRGLGASVSLSTGTDNTGMMVTINIPRFSTTDEVTSELPIVTDISIIVVDDDDDILETTAGYLRWRGCHVRTARTATEARTLCEQEPPMVLFTDVRMPGEDGISLAHSIDDQYPSTAILLMSGEHLPSDDTLPARWGQLQKPFTPEDLISTIRQTMLSSHQRAVR